MAHGDYDCCAVCDCKLSYSNDAQTKEEICPSCIKALVMRNVMVFTPSELIAWIETTPLEELMKVFQEIVFHECYYGNAVDDALKAKGIKFEKQYIVGSKWHTKVMEQEANNGQ